MEFDSIIQERRKLLSPNKNTHWASEMVLNPTMILDPTNKKLHMLFRATGPMAKKRLENKPLPYPIFLGYGVSQDQGETWEFDLETPALTPPLEYEADKLYIENYKGKKVVNYANGCIEDPRFCTIDGQVYLTVACRMFPPGPYWEKDDPMQCAPEWAFKGKHPFGAAATFNHTVTVLYKVDLDELSKKNYSKAFIYMTNLTDPDFGQDRDVVFLPKRQNINGQKKLVMLHRPVTPNLYPYFNEKRPSIAVAYGDTFEQLHSVSAHRYLLATPAYEWEQNRIGASTQPLEISNNLWLLNYHGKMDDAIGYTQSFMLLGKNHDTLEIVARPPSRLITVYEEWEKPNKFKTPCIFTGGMIRINNTLLLSYGAADQFLGIMKLDYQKLMDYLYGQVVLY